jgi:hypothetical protein
MSSFTSNPFHDNKNEYKSSEMDIILAMKNESTPQCTLLPENFLDDLELEDVFENLSTEDSSIHNDYLLQLDSFDNNLTYSDDSINSIFTDQGLDDILAPANLYLFNEDYYANTTTSTTRSSSTTTDATMNSSSPSTTSSPITRKKNRKANKIGKYFERLTSQSQHSSPLKRRWSDVGFSTDHYFAADKNYHELDYLFINDSPVSYSQINDPTLDKTFPKRRRYRSYSTNTTSMDSFYNGRNSSRSGSTSSSDNSSSSSSSSISAAGGGLQVTFGSRSETDLKKINAFLSRHKKTKKTNRRPRSKTCNSAVLSSSTNNKCFTMESIHKPTKLVGGDTFRFPSGGSLTVNTVSNTSTVQHNSWDYIIDNLCE